MIGYRKMTENDIEAGLSLCRSAGWNQLENDWKIFLQLNPDGNCVAFEESGNVIGTVTTIIYEDHFSWIGMVLVDPSKKKQGIGTQLLRESLNILEKQETVKLDATPAGREVYLKFGFKDEYTLCRMMATNIQGILKSDASPANKKDFGFIIEKDQNVFGADREDVLRKINEYYSGYSFVKNNVAYCFGRKGFNFTQVGPVVADNMEDAKQLVAAAFKNISGPVILDVMHDSAFYHWLLSIGFTEQRKLIRMYLGKNKYPGQPEKQFAILGPEFG